MKRIFAAICAWILLVSLASCGSRTKHISFRNAVNQSAAGSTELHTATVDALTECAATESARLFFDETTYNIVYADAYSDRVWSALPERENTLATTVTAVLISESGRYYLNSQDNAVAFGTASYEKTDDGILLTFRMAENEETAKKEGQELESGELYLELCMRVSLDDGRLRAEIDCGSIVLSEGFILEQLLVMPYFGAIVYEENDPVFSDTPEETEQVPSSEKEPEQTEDREVSDEEETIPVQAGAVSAGAADEDYLVLPDGCGAVLYTARKSVTGTNLSFNVHTGDGVRSPYVPAAVFGLKHGDVAFVCAVTQGDAIATVRAQNLINEGGVFNVTYAEFLITDTEITDGIVYYGQTYRGTLLMDYKFLSGVTADYVSMAVAAGEELVRAEILPRTRISNTVYPLNVGVLCSADGTEDTAVTTYSQAEDMLSVLKAKGVNRANILLQGAFSGGFVKKTLSSFRPLRALGGAGAMERLTDYALKQGYDLYAGVNIMTAGKSSAAVGINGAKLSAAADNPLYPEYAGNKSAVYLLQSRLLEKGVLNVLSGAESLSIPGICVNDAARTIYEDIASGYDRSELAAQLRTQLKAISAGRKLAMNGADLGAVSSASLITSLPFDAYYASEENDAYFAIPFFPAMLHGTVIYSGFAANQQSSPYLYLLKTVEYGGAPYYIWDATVSSRLYYEKDLAEAGEFLAKMNGQLDGLLSEPISGHKKLSDGVFSTVYENGSVVIVNYNNYSVNVGGVTVPPYDFLRMN